MLSTRHRGFTIVELLIGVALAAVLLGLGAPLIGTYLHNSKLAAATQDYLTGLQTARTEAIRRNVPVDFVLTDTPVTTSNLANALAPSATGKSWAVRASDPAAAGTYALVDVKAGREGSNSATATSSADIVVTGPVGFAGIITFNGFGGTADGLGYTVDVANAAAGVCKASGGTIRCKRIVVQAGGRITACDPAAGGTDSRACP